MHTNLSVPSSLPVHIELGLHFLTLTLFICGDFVLAAHSKSSRYRGLSDAFSARQPLLLMRKTTTAKPAPSKRRISKRITTQVQTGGLPVQTLLFLMLWTRSATSSLSPVTNRWRSTHTSRQAWLPGISGLNPHMPRPTGMLAAVHLSPGGHGSASIAIAAAGQRTAAFAPLRTALTSIAILLFALASIPTT